MKGTKSLTESAAVAMAVIARLPSELTGKTKATRRERFEKRGRCGSCGKKPWDCRCGKVTR